MNLNIAIFEHQELSKPCLESCGMNWLEKENQHLAEESLKHRFGEKAVVGFYNLAESATRQRFADIIHMAQEQSLCFPLLVVNGKVRISGFFDQRMLLDMLDAEEDLQFG